MYSRSTSPPSEPAHRKRGLSRSAAVLAFVVVLIATAAWLTGLYLAIRWLLDAIF
jgi:hypothetical protein